jgi:hypothetical protein
MCVRCYNQQYYRAKRAVILRQQKARYLVEHEHMRSINRASRKRNIEQIRKHDRERSAQHHLQGQCKKYGLTVKDYTVLLELQHGVCAICLAAPNATRLVVDHCHHSNAVRGLLCHNCNKALGFLNDDVKRIEAMIAYLKRA